MQQALSLLCTLAFGAAGCLALWSLRRDLRALQMRLAGLLAEYLQTKD